MRSLEMGFYFLRVLARKRECLFSHRMPVSPQTINLQLVLTTCESVWAGLCNDLLICYVLNT